MANWVNKTVKEFVALQRGYDLTAEERKLGGVPVMGAAGQNGFHGEARAQGPGIVIGRSGGSYGQVHLVAEDFWPHNTAMYVTDLKGNDPYFAYYFLKNLDFNKLNSGSAQPSLNRNYVYPLKICVPQPAEQQKIAAVLSALDAKIDLNQRINTELDAIAKTVYDYWFVQFDFPDEKGRPYRTSGGAMVWNDALKREIPDRWANGTLADAVQLEYGKPLKEEARTGNGFPVMGSNGIVGYHDEFLIEGPGIVVGRKGTVGAISFSHENFYPIDTTYYVKPCREYGFNFLLYLLRSLSLTRLNSDSAVPGLNRGSALRLPVVLPPVELVVKFDTLTKAFLEKTRNALAENCELSALRDWLLPLLMNGQVRMKDAVSDL